MLRNINCGKNARMWHRGNDTGNGRFPPRTSHPGRHFRRFDGARVYDIFLELPLPDGLFPGVNCWRQNAAY